LRPNVQQSSFGKYLKNVIDELKIGAVGTQAIDFTQNDTTGALFHWHLFVENMY
jgi:hypothetical protein